MYPESLPNCGCPDNTTPPVEAPAPPVCLNGELCEEAINTQCVRYDGPNLNNGIQNTMNMTSIVQILSGVEPGSVAGAILKYVTTIGIVEADSPGGMVRTFLNFDRENSIGNITWTWNSPGEYRASLVASGLTFDFNHAHIAGATVAYNNELNGITVLPIVDNNYNFGSTVTPFVLGYVKIYLMYNGSSWDLVVQTVDTDNVLTDIDTLGVKLINLPELRYYV